MQIPISCKIKVAKAGVFYPAQMQVRCVEVGCQECQGKSGADRMMQPSGKFSFEEHCGRPRNQHLWRQSFKVQRAGDHCPQGLQSEGTTCVDISIHRDLPY